MLEISRGSLYDLPRPTSNADLALMRRIDELDLEHPFAGSRMLKGLGHQRPREQAAPADTTEKARKRAVFADGRIARVATSPLSLAPLLGRRRYRQDARNLPAARRLGQHHVHQEPRLFRLLARRTDREVDRDKDLRRPFSDHYDLQA